MKNKYKTIANLTTCPPIILKLIFPYIDNIKDLLSAAQVCKTWHDVASSDPRLWLNIHITPRVYAGADTAEYRSHGYSMPDDPIALKRYKRDFERVLKLIANVKRKFQITQQNMTSGKLPNFQTLYYDSRQELRIPHHTYTNIILNEACRFRAISLLDVPISSEKLIEVLTQFENLEELAIDFIDFGRYKLNQKQFFKDLKILPDKIFKESKLKKVALSLSLTSSNLNDFFTNFINFKNLRELVLINDQDITLDQALAVKHRFQTYGISFECTLSDS